MLHVLHITNWYPNCENPYEALWIKRQIESLSPHCKNDIVHIHLRKGKPKIISSPNNDGHSSIILWLPVRVYFLWEIIYFALVWFVLIRAKTKNLDAINFHIAYPLCTYIHWIKKMFKIPILINEHWSEYRNNFGIKNPDKTNRIRNIFKHNIPILTVSQALYQDIHQFSHRAQFSHFVLPNVVDFDQHTATIFDPDPHVFFMMSQWKFPKDPIRAFEGFKKYVEKHPSAKLYVAGYGPQLPEMETFVSKNRMDQQIIFVGTLNAPKAREYFYRSKAFIHCSSYETFSVVCAESLAHGCPVIASDVGGIPEFIHDKNGILINHDQFSRQLAQAMKQITIKQSNREKIATDIRRKFAVETIGLQYYSIIKEIIQNDKP